MRKKLKLNQFQDATTRVDPLMKWKENLPLGINNVTQDLLAVLQ